MKRADKLKWSRLIVTREHILLEEDRLVKIINALGDGPLVKWDPTEEGGASLPTAFTQVVLVPKKRVFLVGDIYHLTKGEKVTEYGGTISREEVAGPYVALMGDIHVDGFCGFRLGIQRGRWINEYNRERSYVNVELGRIVRTTRAVEKGEQFFADYGNEYERHY